MEKMQNKTNTWAENSAVSYKATHLPCNPSITLIGTDTKKLKTYPHRHLEIDFMAV